MKKFSLLFLLVVLVGCNSGSDHPTASDKSSKSSEMDKSEKVDKKLNTKPISKIATAQDLTEKKKKLGFVRMNFESGSVKWTAKKIGKKHVGNVEIQSAYLDVAAELAEAEFILDMKSLSSDSKGLTTHLKNQDFFDVSKYPTAKLLLNKAVPRGNGVYQMTGFLTIKGIQKGISFPAEVYETDDGKLMTKAKLSIDRTSWGITYGSGKFFKDLGDKMIKDMVAFEVEVLFTVDES